MKFVYPKHLQNASTKCEKGLSRYDKSRFGRETDSKNDKHDATEEQRKDRVNGQIWAGQIQKR